MKRNNGHLRDEDDFSRRIEASSRFESSRPSRIGPFVLGAMIGGAIGAALALLYAPAEGAELRRGMSETIDDLAQGAKDIVRGAKISAEKLFREGLDGDDEMEEQASHMERTRERADDILEDADRAIAEARRRSSEPSSRHASEE